MDFCRLGIVRGCEGRSSEQASAGVAASEAQISSESTKQVELLDGRVTVDIPEGMQEPANHGGIAVYESGANTITLTRSEVPSIDVTAIMEQTQASMKDRDPDFKLSNQGEFEIAGHIAKTMKGQMKSEARDIYFVMALTVLDDQMVTMIVSGEPSLHAEISARAKQVFSSIK